MMSNFDPMKRNWRHRLQVRYYYIDNTYRNTFVLFDSGYIVRTETTHESVCLFVSVSLSLSLLDATHRIASRPNINKYKIYKYDCD